MTVPSARRRTVGVLLAQLVVLALALLLVHLLLAAGNTSEQPTQAVSGARPTAPGGLAGQILLAALAVIVVTRLSGWCARRVGLPVPKSEVVRNEDDAVRRRETDRLSRRHEAARRQPRARRRSRHRHGRAVRSGFKRAVKESRNGRVVVESFVTGSDYRVLVIGGRMVAIAQRVPAHVIGDGKHTVRELVDITNQDPGGGSVTRRSSRGSRSTTPPRSW